MELPSDMSRRRCVLHRNARIASVVVVVTGMAVMLGWVFEVALLKSISPVFVTMKVNTAICFIMAGVTLWCRLGEGSWVQRLAQVLAVAVGCIGFVTLMEYLFDWNAGIDNILIAEAPGAIHTTHLGRMAISTAVAFMMIAVALSCAKTRFRWRLLVFECCALSVMVVSSTAVLGYVFDEAALRFGSPVTFMALHTGVAFFILSCGVVSLRPGAYCMGIITSDSSGGHFARTWIPVVLLLPLVMSLLHLLGAEWNYIGFNVGEVLQLTVLNVSFVALVIWRAKAMNIAETAIGRLAQEEAQARLTREKAEFISFVSHELRNPLTVIHMGVDTILEGHCGPVPDEARGCLEMLNHHVHRMTCLVKDVLDYQKLASGKMDSTVVPQELNPVVLSGASEVAGCALDFQLDDSVPRVMCDRDMIAEVVTNLLSNAVKYSDGSRIQVKTEAVGDAVKVSITDHGMGIREEDQGHLFQEFYRVHDGGKANAPGTGLGLALCKKIVEAHHGRIGVQSVYGQGATFWFTLPVAPKDASQLSKTDSSGGCRPESSPHG